MIEPTTAVDEVITSLPWVGPLGYKFINVAHINIQEANAVLHEVIRQVEDGLRNVRFLIAIDSRVCVGAIGKGRSSSRALNAVLRRLACVSLAANVEVRVIWVSTKCNPSDAPSRQEPLPARTTKPAWTLPLWDQATELAETRYGKQGRRSQCVSEGLGSPTKEVITHKRAGKRYLPSNHVVLQDVCTCREYYAGTGHLSAGLRRAGMPTVEYELYKGGQRDELCDMTSAKVIDEQIRAVRAGELLYCHFGIVCSSWGIINRIWNGGTRTAASPFGDGSLAREVLGHLQLKQMMKLIHVLIELDIPFTVENPIQSLLWKTPQIIKLLSLPNCESATVDQCMYGLRPPDLIPGSNSFVRKRTRIIGTVRGLSTLTLLCDRSHHHVHAVGKVKVGGRSINRSSAAAAYPPGLCDGLARLVRRHVARSTPPALPPAL